MTGRDAVDREADISVADPATRDLHDDLVVGGLERGKVDPFKGRAWSGQLETIGSGDHRHLQKAPLLGVGVENREASVEPLPVSVRGARTKLSRKHDNCAHLFG